jgi:hypothetical protein
MRRRLVSRTLATCLAAAVGVALLSGSDQPVTAQAYPHWQRLPDPPLPASADRIGVRIGVRIGHRVLVMGARDGAVYHLRTGAWDHLATPVRVAGRDHVVSAGGIAVLEHVRTGRTPSWWSYDARADVWTRLQHLPARLSAPWAFGSEVYALSGHRVVVHSVHLAGWTRLAADPLRPVLRARRVTASAAGTVVHGVAGPRHVAVADRWDGLAWHRSRAATSPHVVPPSLLPPGVPRAAATVVRVGTRLVVVSGSRAWIHTP